MLGSSEGVETRPGKIEAAEIEFAPGGFERRTGQVRSALKTAAGTLPEIGNDHNLGLVISRAGLDPCLPLAMSLDAPKFVFP